MITFADMAGATEALTSYWHKGLILSFREVAVRGLVVVGADMEEVALGTPGEASLYLAGLASAECAFRDGKGRQ